jgi:hypothetical protein
MDIGAVANLPVCQIPLKRKSCSVNLEGDDDSEFGVATVEREI